MHLLQTIAHELEGFAETLLQRPLQFFIHRRPHFVDLLGVVLLQFFQANVDNRANTFQRFAEFFPLTFRSRSAFFAIPRKLVTQSPVQHFETPNDFFFSRSRIRKQLRGRASALDRKKDYCGESSYNNQTNDHVSERGHLFVMSSGVETSLNISETVSIELVRLPTLSPLPSRRNRSCRSSHSLHSSTSLGMTSDHQYFDPQNRTFIPA